jgi:hypothetical protein
MRFMMMITGGEAYEAGLPPHPKLIAAIGKLTEEMTESGVLLAAEGLLPSSKGARIRVSGGRVMVTDGPFAETKEVIGGLAIVRVKSKEEAIAIASSFMALHREILGPGWEGECQIRQLSERPETVGPATHSA